MLFQVLALRIGQRATSGHPGKPCPPGSWKPSPKALGQFAQALGKRYSGHYGGLPRVRYYEVWNKPNITKYLAPQWVGKKAVSPDFYRRMLNSFYKGVNKAQPGAKVIGGVMSPFGDSRKDPLDPARPRLRPLVFLRKLLCLKRNLKSSKCPTKPHFDIVSQHPLNFNKAPRYRPFNNNDVQVATFGKVKKTLRAAERTKHVRPRHPRHRPLWATKYIWYTKPPNPTGVSPMTQARWIEFGFYLLWKGGASVILNYPLRQRAAQPDPTPRPMGNLRDLLLQRNEETVLPELPVPVRRRPQVEEEGAGVEQGAGVRAARDPAGPREGMANGEVGPSPSRRGGRSDDQASRQGKAPGPDRQHDEPGLEAALTRCR